jgi:hypothetical protein
MKVKKLIEILGKHKEKEIFILPVFNDNIEKDFEIITSEEYVTDENGYVEFPTGGGSQSKKYRNCLFIDR